MSAGENNIQAENSEEAEMLTNSADKNGDIGKRSLVKAKVLEGEAGGAEILCERLIKMLKAP